MKIKYDFDCPENDQQKMTKYLNPKYEEAFIGPQISESTKWKGLLTWFSHLDTKPIVQRLDDKKPIWYS